MSVAIAKRAVVLIGKENVGKTRLAAALAQSSPRSQNFRGSTVAVDRRQAGDWEWIATPGMHRASDTETTRPALEALEVVDLAGVLLPCLVTAATIAREQSWRFAGRLLLRQAGFAAGFAGLLAWGGTWL